MKKIKKLSFFLLSSVLLFSCSGRNEEDWKKTVKKELADIKETTYTNYTVQPEGKIYFKNENEEIVIDQFYPPEDSYAVPKGTYDKEKKVYDNGASYLMYLPVRITTENFLSEEETDTGSCYKSLEEFLCYYADPVTKLQFEKKSDGSFIFYTKSVSKYASFQNVYMKDGPDSDPVSVYGRYDMTATYSSSGLLLKEEYHTIDYKTKANGYVDLVCVYNYQ